MKALCVVLITVVALASGCRKGDGDPDSVLVSKGFIDSEKYSIVCRGFPMSDAAGAGKMESAKRSALLNAYFFAKQVFDDTVAPDRDGSVEKYELGENNATVYFIITKGGLKGRLRK